MHVGSFKGVHLWKEAVVFKFPLILVMSVLDLHIELDVVPLF